MSVLKQLKDNTELYFSKCLKIRDKKAQIVPFKVNDSQRRLGKIISDHYNKYPIPERRPTLYIIILKARQQGMSTFTEGIFFKGITLGLEHDSPFNKVAMVISYDDDSAKTINDMAWRFLQYLPNPIKPMNRPIRGKGIYFENPNKAAFENNPGLQSKFIIDTANNKNAGSGYTINYLHISELAKWADAETTMTSLLQSVPDYNSIVIIESTAKGVGGYFHTLWEKAVKGQNNYVPLFIPWYEHKEYETPLVPGEVLQLTQEEKELKELYNLTDEQLKWKRNTTRDKLNGDLDAFKQEYPSNDREAFLTSGRPRFHIPTLQKWYNEAKEGIKGNLEGNTFVEDTKGYLEIWQKPIPDRFYVIGADTSEGKAEGDYSSATVWDSKTHEQVAKWHGHIDPDLFGDELYNLGKYYNNGLLAVEKNNHGFTTINKLKNRGYTNLFQMERYDQYTDKTTQELGFHTNRKTKPLIIDHMASMIRENLISTKDKELISECITFVRNDDGTTSATEGCHDDLVMCSAIALFVMSNYATEYYQNIDNYTLHTDRDKHLPFALQDDIDHNAGWNDL